MTTNRYETFVCHEQKLVISCFIEKICPLIALKGSNGQFEPRKLYGTGVKLGEYKELSIAWRVSSIMLDTDTNTAIITI